MFKQLITIIAFSISTLCCIKQTFSQSALFNHLTIDDGLSYSSISSIAQDSKGFIWIGTYNGLNKYDGYKITQYLSSETDTTKLLSGTIRCLYADNENSLWVGSVEGGLSKIDLLTNQISHFTRDSTDKNGLASNTINDIKEFESGFLYIATNYGLNIFNKKTREFKLITHNDKDPNSLLADPIKTMTKDLNGHIWLGHSGYGLTEYIPKENKFIRYTTSSGPSKLPGNKTRFLFTDSKGLIWISMWQLGMTLYNPKTNHFWAITDTNSLYLKLKEISLVSQIIEDANSDIWMCTAENGIVKYERKTGNITFFENNPDDPESISDNTNLCIMADKNGLIWSGTWKAGLNYFNPNSLKFGHIKHESNKAHTLNDNTVLSFFEKNEKEIMIGTTKNICYFNPITKTFTNFELNPKDLNSLRENSQVNFIFKDFDDTYWYATAGGGLFHHYPKTNKYKIFNVTSDPNSLSNSSPNFLLLDQDNNLWVSTHGAGLNLYNREKENFTHYLLDASNKELFAETPLSLNLDKKGNIWIGTEKTGLIHLDPRKKIFTRMFSKDKKSILYSGMILSTMFDKNGKLWLSCAGRLIELDINTLKYINHTELNPLLTADFIGMTIDHLNNIWLTSSKGLFRYTPRTRDLKIFTRLDGVQSKEFNYQSILRLSNNMIIAGGTNGFNYFNPEEIVESKKTPMVALTDLSVLNKPYQLADDISRIDHLTLSYKDYFFSIQFANASSNFIF